MCSRREESNNIDARLLFKLPNPFSASHIYLVRAGGLVCAVVIAEVLVGFSGLRLSVYAGVRLVDGRDVVAQGDGLHGLVDAAADTLTDLWGGRLGLPRWSGATGATVGGLGGHLTSK